MTTSSLYADETDMHEDVGHPDDLTLYFESDVLCPYDTTGAEYFSLVYLFVCNEDQEQATYELLDYPKDCT